jgi:transposase
MPYAHLPSPSHEVGCPRINQELSGDHVTRTCLGGCCGHGAGRSDRCRVGRLRPFLPVSNGRCGRWRDHGQVIDGILHRVRTGVQWRDLPTSCGPISTRPVPGPPPAPASKGAEAAEHQGETPWQSLLARLVEVVREVKAWAARGEGSPANST